MQCPSCGKPIPEQSAYCLFCGNPIDRPPSAPISFNRQPPVQISAVSLGLYGAIKPMPRKEGQFFREGFYLRFTLADATGIPTVCDGMGVANVRIWQIWPGSPEPVSRLRAPVTFAFKGSLFQFDSQTGQPFFTYRHPMKIYGLKLTEAETHARIELQIMPDGSKETLHIPVELKIDAQEA
jgi:hypothetical protein